MPIHGAIVTSKVCDIHTLRFSCYWFSSWHIPWRGWLNLQFLLMSGVCHRSNVPVRNYASNTWPSGISEMICSICFAVVTILGVLSAKLIKMFSFMVTKLNIFWWFSLFLSLGSLIRPIYYIVLYSELVIGHIELIHFFESHSLPEKIWFYRIRYFILINIVFYIKTQCSLNSPINFMKKITKGRNSTFLCENCLIQEYDN